MRATYNITDDRLRAWFDERLSSDDYQRMRQAGFTFWHGSKCFAAKWSPQAEDLLLELGHTIEADDTPDDVEARVERFAGYAERAQASAESSEQYLAERANTERRRKNALNSIERNVEAAKHWRERIASAIRHAARKERPDVIARRIEGLEKDERKFKRELERKNWHIPRSCYNEEAWRKYSDRKSELEAQLNADRKAGNPWSDARKAEAVAELRPLKEAIFYQDKLEAAWKSHCDWAQRWLDHIQRRLQYERGLLEAAGGIVGGVGASPIDREKFQVGGAIKGGFRGEGWRIITKVNKRTVEVYTPGCSWRSHWKVDRTEISAVATADEVNNAPEGSELWHCLAAYRQSMAGREAAA
jgi:hypothetical protein